MFDIISQVYKMQTHIPGRAMVINVENFNGPNALGLRRKGSGLDVKNIHYMLKSFGFEIATETEDLTAAVSL